MGAVAALKVVIASAVGGADRPQGDRCALGCATERQVVRRVEKQERKGITGQPAVVSLSHRCLLMHGRHQQPPFAPTNNVAREKDVILSLLPMACLSFRA